MDEGVNVKARLGELRMRLGGIGGNKSAIPSTEAPDAIMDKDIIPKGIKAAPPSGPATDSVDSLDEFRSRLGKFRTKQHEEVQQKPAKQRLHALNAGPQEDIVARRDLLEYELRHVNELLEKKVPNKPAPASYESMQTELREVRKELLHCKALNVELDHVKAEVQAQREKVKEKADEDHVLKKGLKEAQAQSALKDAKLAKMQTELIKVKELSGKETALLENKVKEYERQVERVKQEEAHVERVLQQVKAESSNLASKLNEANQQGAQATKNLQELKQKLETVTTQSATVSHELQTVKQARDEAQEKLVRLEKEAEQGQAKHAELTKELQRVAESLDQEKAQAAFLREEHDAAMASHASQSEESKAEVTALENKVAELEAEVTQLKEEIARLKGLLEAEIEARRVEQETAERGREADRAAAEAEVAEQHKARESQAAEAAAALAEVNEAKAALAAQLQQADAEKAELLQQMEDRGGQLAAELATEREQSAAAAAAAQQQVAALEEQSAATAAALELQVAKLEEQREWVQAEREAERQQADERVAKLEADVAAEKARQEDLQGQTRAAGEEAAKQHAAEVEEFRQQVELLEQQQVEQASTNAQLAEANTQLAEANAHLMQEAEAAEVLRKRNEEERERLSQEVQQLTEEGSSGAEARQELEAGKAQIEGELSSIKEELTSVQEKLNMAQTDVEMQRVRLEEQRQAAEEKEAESSALAEQQQKRMDELQGQRDELQQQLQQHQEQSLSANELQDQRSKEHEARVAELEAQVKEAEERHQAELEGQIRSAAQEMEVLRSEMEEVASASETARMHLQEELDEAEAAAEELKAINEELQEQKEAAQAIATSNATEAKAAKSELESRNDVMHQALADVHDKKSSIEKQALKLLALEIQAIMPDDPKKRDLPQEVLLAEAKLAATLNNTPANLSGADAMQMMRMGRVLLDQYAELHSLEAERQSLLAKADQQEQFLTERISTLQKDLVEWGKKSKNTQVAMKVVQIEAELSKITEQYSNFKKSIDQWRAFNAAKQQQSAVTGTEDDGGEGHKDKSMATTYKILALSKKWAQDGREMAASAAAMRDVDTPPLEATTAAQVQKHIEALRGGEMRARAQAAEDLAEASVARDDAAVRELMMKEGAVEALVELAKEMKLSSVGQRGVASALAHVARTEEYRASMGPSAIPVLLGLLERHLDIQADGEGVVEAADAALINLCNKNEENAYLALENGAIPLLLNQVGDGSIVMLSSETTRNAVILLRSLLYFKTPTRSKAMVALFPEVGIAPLVNLLSAREGSEFGENSERTASVAVNTSWVLSTLARESPECQRWINNANGISTLVTLLEGPGKTDIPLGSAIVSALANLSHGSEANARAVCDARAVGPLVRVLLEPGGLGRTLSVRQSAAKALRALTGLLYTEEQRKAVQTLEKVLPQCTPEQKAEVWSRVSRRARQQISAMGE